MTIDELKAKLGEMIEAMEVKGFSECAAHFEIRANEECQLWLRYTGDRCTEFFYGDDPSDMLDRGREWIASRPSVKDQKVRDALTASAKAIEALKEAEIEGGHVDAFAAQLEDAMRTLSENILEDHFNV